MHQLDWSFFNSHRAQLILAIAVSSGITASLIFGAQKIRRETRVRDLKESISRSDDHAVQQLTEYGAAAHALINTKEDERNTELAMRARQGDYDESLILEQLARNRVFLKEDGFKKLRSAFVIVVGCGGVGSHAIATLARSGVSKLRLIDFDQVTLSSLNRHSVATLADVGTPKVHAIRKRLEAITPWVHFECRIELFDESTAEEQLGPLNGQKPDYVIDAIDNIDTKVGLLYYCRMNNIKVISSMGAGAKSDPTRVFIGDISASTDDPLSKSTRVKLRMRGIRDGIPVVFSSEKTAPGKAELLPLSEEELAKGNVEELSVLAKFRVRILPVLGTMPAVFGLSAANHVMLEISGYPHEYIIAKSRKMMYDGMLGALNGQECRLAKSAGHDIVGLKTPLTVDDIGYLVDEIYRGKSVVSGLTTRLMLTRWMKPKVDPYDISVPGQKLSQLEVGELVCMTKEESAKHESEVLLGSLTPEEMYDDDVLKRVAKRFKELKAFEVYR